MKLSRTRSLVAASGLVAMLILPGAALAAGRGGHHGPGLFGQGAHRGLSGQRPHRRHPSAAARHSRSISGTLQTLGATTAPTALTMQTRNGATITVTVATTTTIVRRYDGHSSLDEFSPGDHLTVWGSFADGSATAFNATRIRNTSIQHAFTHLSGRVQSLSNGVATLQVLRRGSVMAPYRRGQTVQVSFSPSVIVMAGAVTATVDAVQPGARIVAMGVYDRHTHVLRAERVRILGSRNGQNPVAQPMATAPATDTPAATATDQATAAPSATPTATDTATTSAITPEANATLTATATLTPTVAPSASGTPVSVP